MIKLRKKNRLVYGVGINDANYFVQPTVNGKQVTCYFYLIWKDMLKRCYSEKFHVKEPTYTGCTCVEEWKLFSNFKAWMEIQNYEGKELDKDILVIGNKTYGPDTCCFVLKDTNSMLTDRRASRGIYPQGVIAFRHKYVAQINIKGSKKHIGVYFTPEEAFQAYCKIKAEQIYQHATELGYEKRIQEGLLRWAKYYEQGLK